MYIPKTCAVPTNTQRNWTYSICEASSWQIYERNVCSCPIAWCLSIKKFHLKVVSRVWNRFFSSSRFRVSFPESCCGNAYVRVYMFPYLYKVKVLVTQKNLKKCTVVTWRFKKCNTLKAKKLDERIKTWKWQENIIIWDRNKRYTRHCKKITIMLRHGEQQK